MERASLAEAMDAHAHWVSVLIKYVAREGPRPADEQLDERTCEIGRWIRGDGRRHGGIDDYHRLQRVHKAFHVQAREIVALADCGATGEAFGRLRPEGAFARLSLDLILAFDDLEAALRRRTPPAVPWAGQQRTTLRRVMESAFDRLGVH